MVKREMLKTEIDKRKIEHRNRSMLQWGYRYILLGETGMLPYSTKPYLVLIRSSFSNIGSPAMRIKITVAAAWIRSMGRPDT